MKKKKINWDSLPYRLEDPCHQVMEVFIDESIEAPILVKVLNALHRQGFTSIEYEANETEVDTAYQKKTYTVSAERLVCMCEAYEKTHVELK